MGRSALRVEICHCTHTFPFRHAIGKNSAFSSSSAHTTQHICFCLPAQPTPRVLDPLQGLCLLGHEVKVYESLWYVYLDSQGILLRCYWSDAPLPR